MARRRDHRCAGGTVHTVFTDRHDGDFAVDSPQRDAVRSALVPRGWTWLRQVHGPRVVEVARPAGRCGEEADAAVTACPGAVVAVQVADCAPVLLWGDGPDGVVVAAVHAGWRGLAAGVVGRAVGEMRRRGVEQVSWDLGLCICAECYEFSDADLRELEARMGPAVRSLTAAGAPALDLRAAVAATLATAGVPGPPVSGDPACTAHDPALWSHRASGDTARQVGAIWFAAEGEQWR